LRRILRLKADFKSIRKYFFIRGARFLSFHCPMSTGKDAATETVDWYVEAERASPNARGRISLRAQRDEQRANSLALIIATAILFVLFAAAIMFGGRAAIGPLLSRAIDSRDVNGTGDIVYAMPDGVFCRHMSFDNATGEVTEGAIAQCPDRIGGGGLLTNSKFKWGAH
jgi:hypothetical protein